MKGVRSLVRCPKCGRENPDDAEVCLVCGAKLEKEKIVQLRLDLTTVKFKVRAELESFFYLFTLSFLCLLLMVLWFSSVALFRELGLISVLMGIYVIIEVIRDKISERLWIISIIYSLIGLSLSLVFSYWGIVTAKPILCVYSLVFIFVILKALADRKKFIRG